VLLATDLHAGNVLRAQREPWLVIDPKPFLGDPAYDATQHLFNSRGSTRSRSTRSAGSPTCSRSTPRGSGSGRSRAPPPSRATTGRTTGPRSPVCWLGHPVSSVTLRRQARGGPHITSRSSPLTTRPLLRCAVAEPVPVWLPARARKPRAAHATRDPRALTVADNHERAWPGLEPRHPRRHPRRSSV